MSNRPRINLDGVSNAALAIIGFVVIALIIVWFYFLWWLWHAMVAWGAPVWAAWFAVVFLFLLAGRNTSK